MLAQARKYSVDVCDNILKNLDKIVYEIKVVLSQNNQDQFDLNWKKAFVGKIDASQKFEDRIFKCRYDFYYLQKPFCTTFLKITKNYINQEFS